MVLYIISLYFYRSLAKYSSEEESDGEVKVKRDKNRRATVAASFMQPPAASKSRKTTKTVPKEEPVNTSSAATVSSETRTTTRRTTRIVKPVDEGDFETGSDSETEIGKFAENDGAGDAGLLFCLN